MRERKMTSLARPSHGLILFSGAVYRRIPLFRDSEPCEIFLRLLESYRIRYGVTVFAYVLMPDHFHLLLHFPPERRLADFLRDFKSLAGKQILEWIRDHRRQKLLALFELKRTRRRLRDPRYCILQYRSHLKRLKGSALRAAVRYIHLNPVRAELVESPEDYPWSSASVYSGKRQSVVQITYPE
jgi:REP-associated tyrosine transposase